VLRAVFDRANRWVQRKLEADVERAMASIPVPGTLPGSGRMRPHARAGAAAETA
jgi:hypothetical protein